MRWLAFAFALLPLEVSALSCTPWGVADAYLTADAAKEAYIPVLGTLRFDPKKLPQVDLAHQDQVPAMTRIPARFEGHTLGHRGDQPWSADVTLEVACFGPWCSQPQPGPVLAFLRKDGARYALATDPCGGFLFNEPRAEQVQQMRQCLAGRRCRPSRRR